MNEIEKVLITESSMDAIGDAIRDRNGSLTTYLPSEMAAAIESIPNNYTLADEGKVVKNGALIAQTARATEITVNGTYDTTENNEVTVNVSGGSDDPFALKNYIESSGTQYIDTGYEIKDNTRFVLVCNYQNTNNYPSPFGCRESYQHSSCLIWLRVPESSTGGVYCWSNDNGNNAEMRNINFMQYSGYKVEFDVSKAGSRYEKVDDYLAVASIRNTHIGTPLSQRSLYLFVLNDGGSANNLTFCSMKLYRFRIYEGNELVHEFIPWQENGVACLKDTFTSNLLYNAGTNNFVYGTDT